MDVAVLGSGSGGNATLIRGGGACVLVDAGLSAKQMELRMATFGISPADLDGILLTHEHVDHSAGLRVFLSKWKIPVYCNTATARSLPYRDPSMDMRFFQTGAFFAIKDLRVKSFSVPHDASDPVGFRLEEGHSSFGVLTDLGYATRLVFDALREVRGLLIETNYDEALLQNDTKRPWSVKQRIASRHGHLSNTAAAQVVAQLEAPALEALVLCHLSRDCNTPDLATSTLEGRHTARPKIHCSTQNTPTEMVSF